MGLLDNGKKELFGALQGGGITNPISGPKSALDAKAGKLQEVLSIGGLEPAALGKATDSLSRLDSYAGSLTGDIGATLGKVNSASDIMNEYTGVLPGASACFNTDQALGVLGEQGKKALGMIEDALSHGYDTLTAWLGAGWEAMGGDELVAWVKEKLSGLGDGFLGELMQDTWDLLEKAGQWADDLIDQSKAYLSQMDQVLKDYVGALQLSRFMSHDCFAGIVDNIAGPEVKSALGKIENLSQLV